jgi:hypothetical protein
MDYKKELTKLLAKSKGTAYESSLKRFVEKKLREINRDQEEHPTSLVSQRDEMNSEDEREGKLTLMSLSSSKYERNRKTTEIRIVLPLLTVIVAPPRFLLIPPLTTITPNSEKEKSLDRDWKKWRNRSKETNTK